MLRCFWFPWFIITVVVVAVVGVGVGAERNADAGLLQHNAQRFRVSMPLMSDGQERRPIFAADDDSLSQQMLSQTQPADNTTFMSQMPSGFCFPHSPPPPGTDPIDVEPFILPAKSLTCSGRGLESAYAGVSAVFQITLDAFARQRVRAGAGGCIRVDIIGLDEASHFARLVGIVRPHQSVARPSYGELNYELNEDDSLDVNPFSYDRVDAAIAGKFDVTFTVRRPGRYAIFPAVTYSHGSEVGKDCRIAYSLIRGAPRVLTAHYTEFEGFSLSHDARPKCTCATESLDSTRTCTSQRAGVWEADTATMDSVHQAWIDRRAHDLIQGRGALADTLPRHWQPLVCRPVPFTANVPAPSGASAPSANDAVAVTRAVAQAWDLLMRLNGRRVVLIGDSAMKETVFDIMDLLGAPLSDPVKESFSTPGMSLFHYLDHSEVKGSLDLMHVPLLYASGHALHCWTTSLGLMLGCYVHNTRDNLRVFELTFFRVTHPLRDMDRVGIDGWLTGRDSKTILKRLLEREPATNLHQMLPLTNVVMNSGAHDVVSKFWEITDGDLARERLNAYARNLEDVAQFITDSNSVEPKHRFSVLWKGTTSFGDCRAHIHRGNANAFVARMNSVANRIAKAFGFGVVDTQTLTEPFTHGNKCGNGQHWGALFEHHRSSLGVPTPDGSRRGWIGRQIAWNVVNAIHEQAPT